MKTRDYFRVELEKVNGIKSSQTWPALDMIQPLPLSCSYSLIQPPHSQALCQTGRSHSSRDWLLHPCTCVTKHAWVHREHRHTCPWASLHMLCCFHLLWYKRAYTLTCTHISCHVLSPTCTRCAQDQEEVEHCQQQAKKEPPLSLALKP